jgi:hypothetical protein
MPQLKVMLTQVGEPRNHRQLVTRYDALLRRLNVEPPTYRHLLIAHSLVAAGWKQNLAWYNAWGVKRGTWKGDYYTWSTKEEKDGELYDVPGAEWRAFHSWREAVDDTKARIGPDSWSGSYVAAYRVAMGTGNPRDYWDALGSGGYFTAKRSFTTDMFVGVHERVLAELAAATPDEKAAAESWVDSEVDAGRMGMVPGTRRVPPAGIVGQIFGGLALGAIIVGTIFVGRALAKKPTYAGASRW